MLTVNDALESSPFFSSLDETLKDKFRHRLLKRLKAKLVSLSDTQSLADIEISTDNAFHIHKHISNTLSFSWLGLVFGPVWAAYMGIPYAVIVVSCLFLVTWPVLLVDHAMYLQVNEALSRGGIGVGVVFAMYGRSWLISHELAKYLEIKFPAQYVGQLSAFAMLGLGFRSPQVRMLFVITLIGVFTAIELTIEFYLHA